MKKCIQMKHIVAMLALIVAVSGCVSGGEQREVKVVSTEGIQINKFNVDPAFVNENEIVRIDVDIENVGGATAKNVVAKLVGTGGAWRSTAATPTPLALDQEIVTTTDLEPPRPSENAPGDFKIGFANIRAPDLPEGVQTDFPIMLRVDYQYKTSGSVVIPTIEKSLYQEKNRAGQAIDSSTQVSNNNAPLKVAMGAGRVPAVVDTGDGTGAANTETFILEVQNVGSGMPIGKTSGKIGEITGKIGVIGGSIYSLKCGSAAVVTSPPFTQDVVEGDEARIRTTGKVEIPCDVKFKTMPAGTMGTLVFTVDLDYKYFLTQAKSVKVEGR